MNMTSQLLLVEDEALVRETLAEALRDAGFEVVCASNGEDAMKALKEGAAGFSAVITDIRLGAGPDGWDVGRRARELAADLPVVYMSGDSTQDWSSRGVPNSVVAAKPFVPAQILTAVTMLMNEAATRKAGA
jgi:DNA-binding response OmpR family regulator